MQEQQVNKKIEFNLGVLVLMIRWLPPLFFLIGGFFLGNSYPNLTAESQQETIKLILSFSEPVKYSAYMVISILIMYTQVILLGRTQKSMHWMRNLTMYALPFFSLGFALRFFSVAIGFTVGSNELEGSINLGIALGLVFFLKICLPFVMIVAPTFENVGTSNESFFRFKIAPCIIVVTLIIGFFEYAV